jgi:spermidine/putrescine transport system ATP-binding protein
VTHDQEEALTMSDRIAVMNRGVIEQLDDPEEIYERPSTTFVAGFIGVSNLMPARVVSSNGSGGELRLDSGVQVRADIDSLRVGERCYAVVRPEKLRIERADEPSNGDRPSVDGVIESSLYLGTATQFVVRLPDGVAMTVLVPNADEAERQRLPGGGVRVRLTWQSEHTHVVREAEGSARAEAEMNDDSEMTMPTPAEPATTQGRTK